MLKELKIDYEKWRRLKSGYYGWHILSPEYKQMEADNESLCESIKKAVKTFTPRCPFVNAIWSHGEISVDLWHSATATERWADIRDKIIEILGERYCGWVYDEILPHLRIYFYGIDPQPYIEKWEKRMQEEGKTRRRRA